MEGDFANASLSKLKDYTKEEMNKIHSWVKNPKHFFVYMGDPGLGKTYLAAALYNFWWYEGEDIMYREFPSIFSTMQYDIKEGKHQDNEVVKLVEADILIINDAGATKYSEWIESQFYKIIDPRYMSKKPTIITTNLSEREMENYFGKRIASRLTASNNFQLEKWGKDKDKRKLGM